MSLTPEARRRLKIDPSWNLEQTINFFYSGDILEAPPPANHVILEPTFEVITPPQEESEVIVESDSEIESESDTERSTESDIEEISDTSNTSDTADQTLLGLGRQQDSEDSTPPSRSESASSSEYGTPEVNTPGPSQARTASETPVSRPKYSREFINQQYKEVRKKAVLSEFDQEILAYHCAYKRQDKELKQEQGRSTRYNPQGIRNFFVKKK